jgi:predicted GH43/DUF377 family glycosyl hydrolase
MTEESDLPAYYRSLISIQPGFTLQGDQTRRLPAVLEHTIKPERMKSMTEELSRLSAKELEGRLHLLHRCFDGITGLENYLLKVYNRYFGAESPLNGCSQSVRIAAAAAIVQAFPYEGVACFNPTIAPHPDQSGTADGELRVVLGLRSYGEFHRSSLSFRTGMIDAAGNLALDVPEKTDKGFTRTCLPEVEGTMFVFADETNLDNTVLYGPFVTDIGETWEDLRLTPFADEGDYAGWYLGTFTSFNFFKRRLQASVLITRDFKTFEYHPMRGTGAVDKDMAYFPKKIKGRYAMLSRNDGRDLFLMTSDDPLSWSRKKKIAACRPDSFDAHKMGVCAPPIETPLGWLVIYHGVADPGQIYSLGAMLLDLEDPARVLARLPYTIHSPFFDDALGMLSSINYTCGAIVHEASASLVLPFACNDTFCKVGRIGLDELLARLMDDGRQ